jgi:beta-lactamase class A
MMIRFIFIICCLVSSQAYCKNYTDIDKYINQMQNKHKVTIGVASVLIETGDNYGFNDNKFFHMASTVKIPILAYVLKLNDENQFDLSKKINITTNDMVGGSGVIELLYTDYGLELSNLNLLSLMMRISDNSATDIIIKQVGGIDKIAEFFKPNYPDIKLSRNIMELFVSESITLKELSLKLSEEDKKNAAIAFDQDMRDKTTPNAMIKILQEAQFGSLLSKKNKNLMYEIMAKTKYSGKRILYGLPENTKAAHKSGSWWISKYGYYYTNDVAIIKMPNNNNLLLAIYVHSNHNTDTATQEKLIIEITKKIYDLADKKWIK